MTSAELFQVISNQNTVLDDILKAKRQDLKKKRQSYKKLTNEIKWTEDKLETCIKLSIQNEKYKIIADKHQKDLTTKREQLSKEILNLSESELVVNRCTYILEKTKILAKSVDYTKNEYIRRESEISENFKENPLKIATLKNDLQTFSLIANKYSIYQFINHYQENETYNFQSGIAKLPTSPERSGNQINELSEKIKSLSFHELFFDNIEVTNKKYINKGDFFINDLIEKNKVTAQKKEVLETMHQMPSKLDAYLKNELELHKHEVVLTKSTSIRNHKQSIDTSKVSPTEKKNLSRDILNLESNIKISTNKVEVLKKIRIDQITKLKANFQILLNNDVIIQKNKEQTLNTTNQASKSHSIEISQSNLEIPSGSRASEILPFNNSTSDQSQLTTEIQLQSSEHSTALGIQLQNTETIKIQGNIMQADDILNELVNSLETNPNKPITAKTVQNAGQSTENPIASTESLLSELEQLVENNTMDTNLSLDAILYNSETAATNTIPLDLDLSEYSFDTSTAARADLPLEVTELLENNLFDTENSQIETFTVADATSMLTTDAINQDSKNTDSLDALLSDLNATAAITNPNATPFPDTNRSLFAYPISQPSVNQSDNPFEVDYTQDALELNSIANTELLLDNEDIENLEGALEKQQIEKNNEFIQLLETVEPKGPSEIQTIDFQLEDTEYNILADIAPEPLPSEIQNLLDDNTFQSEIQQSFPQNESSSNSLNTPETLTVNSEETTTISDYSEEEIDIFTSDLPDALEESTITNNTIEMGFTSPENEDTQSKTLSVKAENNTPLDQNQRLAYDATPELTAFLEKTIGTKLHLKRQHSSDETVLGTPLAKKSNTSNTTENQPDNTNETSTQSNANKMSNDFRTALRQETAAAAKRAIQKTVKTLNKKENQMNKLKF